MRKFDWIMVVLNMTALAGLVLSYLTNSTGMLKGVAIVIVQWNITLWSETSRLNRRIEALERATPPSATPSDLTVVR